MGQRSRAPPGGSGGAELPEHGSLFIVIIITFFGSVSAARGGGRAQNGRFQRLILPGRCFILYDGGLSSATLWLYKSSHRGGNKRLL